MSTYILEQPTVAPAMSTIEDLFPYEDDGNSRHTHIVNPPMNKHVSFFAAELDAQDIVDAARMLREEIVALCGYRWVPDHNPAKYDVCQECMRIAQQIMAEEGE